jgi:hypothetical protein
MKFDFNIKDKHVIKFAFVFSALGLITLVITILVYLFKGYINGNDIDPSLFGTLGDFIGGIIGTIFTIVATSLVFITYRSQKDELKQTNEIALNQSKTLVLQQFENTFFNLLISFNDTSRNLRGVLPLMHGPDYEPELSDEVDEIDEGKYIKWAMQTLNLTIWDWVEEAGETIPLIDNVIEIFDEFFQKYLIYTNHYFNHFALILRFIDSSLIDKKKFYTDILRSKMQKDELGLIYLYGLSKEGKDKIYDFLQKYNFLESIPQNTFYKKNIVDSKAYPFISFVHLDIKEKDLIFIKSIIRNPDKISPVDDFALFQWYCDKYNYGILDLGRIYRFYSENEIKGMEENTRIACFRILKYVEKLGYII